MVDPKTGRFDELPHIGPGNIESFTGKILDNVLKVKDSNLISGKFHFYKGDIIYGKINPQLGKYAIAPYEGLSSADSYVLNTKKGVVPKFLYTMLQTKDFYKYSVSVSSRTGMPKINREELNVYNYKAPKLEEQIKIGNFFVELEHLFALYQQKLDKLKELKNAYLDHIFNQKIRFLGFTVEWEQRKFSDIITRISKQSNDANLPKVEYEDIISCEGRLNKDISQKNDDRKGIEFEPNFVLFGKLRPYLKNWLHPNFKGIAIGDFWVFEPKHSSSTFIYYLIQTDKYQIVANLSSGTKMPRSDWKTVSETEFCVPSIEEQIQIGNFLEQLDSAITLYQAKKDKFDQLKQGFLQKMFI